MFIVVTKVNYDQPQLRQERNVSVVNERLSRHSAPNGAGTNSLVPMFYKHLRNCLRKCATLRGLVIRLLLAVSLVACLAWLAVCLLLMPILMCVRSVHRKLADATGGFSPFPTGSHREALALAEC